jgi:isoleucyl-tRNA synthetase
VLAAHLLCLVRGIAPVLPHMAEDAWSHVPFVVHQDDGSETETVFEAGWPKIDERWRSISEEDLSLWSAILQVLVNPMKTIQNALFSDLSVLLNLHHNELCNTPSVP